MTHLGDRISSLVDGQLPIEQIERAHAHLANCRECREAVEAERSLKAVLGGLGMPQASGDLLSRLVALGGPAGPLPPRPGRVPGTPRPAPVPVGAVSSPDCAPDAVTAEAALVGAALVDAGASGHVVTARTSSATGAARRSPLSGRSSRPAGRPHARPDGRSERAPSRPAGRSGARRVRLAGAVLGALGVVGAGVGGLVLVAGPAPAGTPGGPAADHLTVARAVPTAALLPENVSLITSSRPAPSQSSSR